MTDDKDFVCAHWERAEACPSPEKPLFCISLGGRMFTRVTVPNTISGYAPTEALAWSAAAEYTRERLEQIRLVEREIELISSWIDNRLSWIIPVGDDIAWEGPGLADKARYVATFGRVLARERATLEDLKRGMR